MEFITIQLLRQRRGHLAIEKSSGDKIPQRRSTMLRHSTPFHVPIICWMTFIIIAVITAPTTRIGVAGFQRPARYQQLQYIRTNQSPRNLPPIQPRLFISDASATTTISIQSSHQQQSKRSLSRRSKTQLYFMGSDSGILGVGGPEVVRSCFVAVAFGAKWWIIFSCASFLLPFGKPTHMHYMYASFSVFDCTGWILCFGSI